MNLDPPLRLGIVLLAAGASSRMGRPKLLLPWGNTTILGHLLAQWRQLHPMQVVVVLSAADEQIPAELDRLAHSGNGDATDRVFNPDPSRGMFSSIQVAAACTAWRAGLTHWLVSLGDQPLASSSTLRRLLDEAAQWPERIAQPARNGRPRHPVVFPAAHFRALASAREANLKEFLTNRAAARHCFESDDPGLDIDLDYPADYEKAVAIAQAMKPQ